MSKNKKVLIITYYWPPSGGAGVQRWLKFVKYLPKYGWEPIIYTPENGEIPVVDESLAKDIPEGTKVLKTNIWEPYSVYKKFVGQKKDEKINTGFLTEFKKTKKTKKTKKPKKAEKAAVWIRGNFFIPDARKFWIKPSVKYLTKYFKENPVDAIISTGPPHSMHLIALKLKQKIGVKWFADFRDPWTNIDYYKDLMLTSLADKKHIRLEKQVLETADSVISIGKTMADEFYDLGAKKVEVITNGYDITENVEVELDKKFSIAHIGTLVKSRNPFELWNVLADLVEENKTFSESLDIKLVGKVDINVMNSIKENGLDKYLTKIDYLPHNEVILEQRKTQLLLLLVNRTPNAKGILTGKFFEYLSAKRPICVIGPKDGEIAKIVNETKAGFVTDYNNESALKNEILKSFEAFLKGNLNIQSSGIEKYSRENLTKELVNLMEG